MANFVCQFFCIYLCAFLHSILKSKVDEEWKAKNMYFECVAFAKRSLIGCIQSYRISFIYIESSVAKSQSTNALCIWQKPTNNGECFRVCVCVPRVLLFVLFSLFIYYPEIVVNRIEPSFDHSTRIKWSLVTFLWAILLYRLIAHHSRIFNRNIYIYNRIYTV